MLSLIILPPLLLLLVGLTRASANTVLARVCYAMFKHLLHDSSSFILRRHRRRKAVASFKDFAFTPISSDKRERGGVGGDRESITYGTDPKQTISIIRSLLRDYKHGKGLYGPRKLTNQRSYTLNADPSNSPVKCWPSLKKTSDWKYARECVFEVRGREQWNRHHSSVIFGCRDVRSLKVGDPNIVPHMLLSVLCHFALVVAKTHSRAA